MARGSKYGHKFWQLLLCQQQFSFQLFEKRYKSIINLPRRFGELRNIVNNNKSKVKLSEQGNPLFDIDTPRNIRWVLIVPRTWLQERSASQGMSLSCAKSCRTMTVKKWNLCTKASKFNPLQDCNGSDNDDGKFQICSVTMIVIQVVKKEKKILKYQATRMRKKWW